MEKDTAHRVGAPDIVLPPLIGKSEMMVINLEWHLIRGPLGTCGLKEGAAGAIGE
jgi:hypothetical protein